jgi:iron(III) transport system permease protein
VSAEAAQLAARRAPRAVPAVRGVAAWRGLSEAGWIHLLLGLAVLAFGVAPLLRLVVAALTPEGVWQLSGAIEQIGSRAAARATWNTIETSAVSALGALVLGAGFALMLALTDVRAKRALGFLFVFSLMVAPQVAALAFLSLAGPGSIVLGALGLAPEPGTPNPLLGRGGVSLVLALHHAPLVAITVWAGCRYVPRSIIEAAQVDGASAAQLVGRIVLPMLAATLVAAGLLAFVAAVGNFGIPAMLGLPVNYLTLPTLIYRRLTSFGPTVLSDMAALALLTALIAAIGIAAGALLLRRARAMVEPGERMGPFIALGSARPLVEAALWSILALKIGLPVLSLLGDALRPALGAPLTLDTVTLRSFAEVLIRQESTVRAFRNSFLLSGATAALLYVLSILFAWVLVRRLARARPIVEALIETPYALPGIVLAIACILLFLKPLPLVGVSIYGTAFIILFAYLARFLAPALKPTLAAMAQIEPHQEEAALLDGASLPQLLRLIVAPTLAPAAAAGALLAFLIAFNELTVSALLWSAGTETLGVVVFSLKEAGLAGEAAAVAVSASIVVLGVMALLDRAAGRLPEGSLPWRF